MWFRKFFVGVLLVCSVVSFSYAEYIEESTSPENLIKLLQRDFSQNSSWITEDNLITAHSDELYFLGALTDYAIVKELANNNVGTNFTTKDDLINMYEIYKQVGESEEILLETYKDTLDALTGTKASLITPVLNSLYNKYSVWSDNGMPNDFISNTYGRLTNLIAVHNLITSCSNPKQLSTIKESTIKKPN